ncbi:MAG TPA: threonine/serine exporter family protein [Caproicibacter sp.]|nr:threonine/serine exporter family protein [Caproicibacter sp.]
MNTIIQFVIAMLGTLSFAVLFSAPQKEYVWCSVTGGLGWVVYLLIIQMHGSIALATLCAAFILTILSRALSFARKKPLTIFLIPGIFPLVPGADIYYTAYYFISNQKNLFFNKAVETTLIAGAIALGIFFGSLLPQIWFRKVFSRKESQYTEQKLHK